MSTVLLAKIACLLAALTLLIGTIWSTARKSSNVRAATPAEKKIVTQKMTGWGDTFAKHK